jgi:hypothetical protein
MYFIIKNYFIFFKRLILYFHSQLIFYNHFVIMNSYSFQLNFLQRNHWFYLNFEIFLLITILIWSRCWASHLLSLELQKDFTCYHYCFCSMWKLIVFFIRSCSAYRLHSLLFVYHFLNFFEIVKSFLGLNSVTIYLFDFFTSIHRKCFARSLHFYFLIL